MPEGHKHNSEKTAAAKNFSRRDFLAVGGAAAAAPAFITAAMPATAVAAQNFDNAVSFATDRRTEFNSDALLTDAVNFVTNRGLMDGSVGNFNPDAYMSRAAAVTALYRLAGSPAVTYEPVFTDVPAGQPYSAAVMWANEIGVITASGDRRFGPAACRIRGRAALKTFFL